MLRHIVPSREQRSLVHVAERHDILTRPVSRAPVGRAASADADHAYVQPIKGAAPVHIARARTEQIETAARQDCARTRACHG